LVSGESQRSIRRSDPQVAGIDPKKVRGLTLSIGEDRRGSDGHPRPWVSHRPPPSPDKLGTLAPEFVDQGGSATRTTAGRAAIGVGSC
jgi:hypothetical protein